MKTIREIENLEGVRVILRADFNVPIQNGKVMNDFRIRSAMPTIRFLTEKGAKVILISHLEVKEGESNSLLAVSEVLRKLDLPVKFISNWKQTNQFIEDGMNNGEALLLENIRNYEGEKKNDPSFTKELASLGDIYVNDAFSVSHREHASVVGLPAYLPSYIGLQFEQEVVNLSKAFKPNHPFLFILGGAKFETKLPILRKFIKNADNIFVGGALANDFFRTKGFEVGTSLLSKDPAGISEYSGESKIMIPTDVVVDNHNSKKADSVNKGEMICDIGPESVKNLKSKVDAANFILWNGPLGLYEKGFTETTLELAKMIAERTSNKTEVTSIVGGGDTLSAISKLNNEKDFTFVSTGGGAMLDFLANETLPGIAAIKRGITAALL